MNQRKTLTATLSEDNDIETLYDSHEWYTFYEHSKKRHGENITCCLSKAVLKYYILLYYRGVEFKCVQINISGINDKNNIE